MDEVVDALAALGMLVHEPDDYWVVHRFMEQEETEIFFELHWDRTGELYHVNTWAQFKDGRHGKPFVL